MKDISNKNVIYINSHYFVDASAPPIKLINNNPSAPPIELIDKNPSAPPIENDEILPIAEAITEAIDESVPVAIAIPIEESYDSQRDNQQYNMKLSYSNSLTLHSNINNDNYQYCKNNINIKYRPVNYNIRRITMSSCGTGFSN